MEKFGKSQPVTRFEDQRFLTGHGRYVDDITPDGALFAHVLRSPVAHGAITALNVDDARSAPGVHLVLTADDLAKSGVTEGMAFNTIKNRDGSPAAAPRRPILAEGRLRFVGEPVAMIVADTLDQARDAAEMIELEYDDLPVHMDIAAGGTPLHDEAPDNRAFDWAMGDEQAVEAAIAKAAHVVRMPLHDNRIISNPMEPRGCYAETMGNRLHLAVNGQGVWGTKRNLARVLGMSADDIRVTNPDVGGGFGTKAMDYPETYLVAHAARVLGQPVRWMADRGETMLADNAGRGLDHDLTLAFDADLKITAYRVDSRVDLGAYCSTMGQGIQTDLFSKVLMGVYDVQDTFLHVEGFFTNTAQVDAYRGAGRPEAIYALERVMDRAARELGVDPWDLHRRNFIPASAFPYVSSTGETYDVGDFNRVLDRAAIGIDLRRVCRAQGGKRSARAAARHGAVLLYRKYFG